MVKRKDILSMSLELLSNHEILQPNINTVTFEPHNINFPLYGFRALYSIIADIFWIASMDNLVLISMERLHAKLYPFWHCLFGKQIHAYK